MATRGETGKAWVAAHLFSKEEHVAEREVGPGRGDGPAGWLGRLRVGQPRREGRLELVPLLLDGNGDPPGVLLTSQAIKVGVLEIVERGSGVVQELLARNKGERPVAILEGDTLVGCKQNRVVAHSVIVAPGTSLGVPVGCMERGRWSHETSHFTAGAMKMAPEVRQRTVRDLKASARTGSGRQLDQSRLWSDVDAELTARGVRSSTSDYYEIVERAGRDALERALALAPVAGQVGAIVLADGALVGFEVTGHHGLWSVLSPPTLASYLMGRPPRARGVARGVRRAWRVARAGPVGARERGAGPRPRPGPRDRRARPRRGGTRARHPPRPRRGLCRVTGNGPAVAATWVTLANVNNEPGRARRSLAPNGPTAVRPWIRARERDDGAHRPS